MKRLEADRLRDSYLATIAKDDDDDLAVWAKKNAGTLILTVQQLSDALTFWVERCDRLEADLPPGLPTIHLIRGIGSWSYAVGRALVPKSGDKS